LLEAAVAANAFDERIARRRLGERSFATALPIQPSVPIGLLSWAEIWKETIWSQHGDKLVIPGPRPAYRWADTWYDSHDDAWTRVFESLSGKAGRIVNTWSGDDSALEVVWRMNERYSKPSAWDAHRPDLSDPWAH